MRCSDADCPYLFSIHDKDQIMINAFSISRLPNIEFGNGKVLLLPQLIRQYGQNALIVTGANFLQATECWQTLTEALRKNEIEWSSYPISGEPSPIMVDAAVEYFANQSFDVVVAIGGGSVLDGAKAIAGLLKVKRSVMDYLEGVGLEYEGPSVPFIAVPTTAGTGSEATKNAVISVQDKEQGFKKSFRHEMLVAEYAILDPELLTSCPKDLIAANGMDALTQLIESYVSTKANPITDALSLSGIAAVKKGLFACYESSGNTVAQGQMAYAALLSGITLAQVGLGSVHGLASPMGAFFPIAHGVVCGTLLAEATNVNILSMQKREPNNIALKKYATIGRLLSDDPIEDDNKARFFLISLLRKWTEKLDLPSLSSLGVVEADLKHIVKHCRGSSMKTNPILLTDDEIKSLLLLRLLG